MATTNRAPHILYTLALQADERFTAVIQARTAGNRNRWTFTAADLINHPEIREALRAKQTADEAWLAFMRFSSEQRVKAVR